MARALSEFWYHWAPTARRNQIKRLGLVPGKWSTDRLWKPPYICLGEYPEVAWMLSGGTARGKTVAEWDLWQVWIEEQAGYEELYFDTGNIKEIRVYDRIYKRNLWFVGTRQ